MQSTVFKVVISIQVNAYRIDAMKTVVDCRRCHPSEILGGKLFCFFGSKSKELVFQRVELARTNGKRLAEQVRTAHLLESKSFQLSSISG